MNPTLRQPDLLTVVRYGERRIQPGDVICFRPPQGSHTVVHRVVSVSAQGIRTRGDNNPSEDDHWLQPSDVLGQVVAARDSRGERRIAGSWHGQLTRRGVLLGRGVWRLGGRLLHGLYYALARSGLF
ncbi:MAG: signal peptidase I, partial [Chloroflexi bacterium]|nr:signal peptidase I [Chloroflexota bacterium]